MSAELVKSSQVAEKRVQKLSADHIVIHSSQVEKQVEKMSAELVKSSQGAEKRVQKLSVDYIVLNSS